MLIHLFFMSAKRKLFDFQSRPHINEPYLKFLSMLLVYWTINFVAQAKHFNQN
jgi:hypothetical protein